MTDLLLNPCGDIDVTEGKLSIVRQADAVRQSWLIHIRTFLGEWFLDQRIGVPYIQRLTSKALSRDNVQQIFASASLEVPGIKQVLSVVVNELNVATRFADITVTALIDGEEGEEQGQFRYYDGLPPEGCKPAVTCPEEVSGLIAWFDVMDQSSWVQVPGSSLVLRNKAGEGTATAVGSPLPQVVGYSPINGRRAVRTEGTGHLQVDGIPAIRPTTGFNPEEFTLFNVSVMDSGLFEPGEPRLWGLDGVQNDGVTQEFYNGYQVLSTPLYKDPGNGGLGIRSEEVGTPNLSTLQSTAEGMPSVQDDSPAVRVWAHRSGDPNETKLWQNCMAIDQGVIETRLLNGKALICAGYDDFDGSPRSFLQGHWGEWLLYSRYLTDAEVDKISRCLAEKWGIPCSVVVLS